MALLDDITIAANGNIRRAPGASSTRYPMLDLHRALQAQHTQPSDGTDDFWSVQRSNPSKLDGPRDPAVASRLNLLTPLNIDDELAQYHYFGSVKQDGGNTQYSGLKTIGGIVAGTPMYVVQNGSKLTKFWGDGHIQILVKVKTGGAFIDSGKVRVFSRKFGLKYSDFEVDLAAGGEAPAAMATANDGAVVLSEAAAAALSSKVTITFGDTTQDLGNGNGPKLYKGTIALSGGCTLQEAYQYLMYITREASSAVLNGVPGWRYLALDSSYTPISEAPFGTYNAGIFLLARGWWITGVLGSEAQSYVLRAHDDTVQTPPVAVSVSVGNLRAGDYVLVARKSGDDIISNEFQLASSGTAGETTITLNAAPAADRPTSGIIRIGGRPHAFTSRSGNTVTLAGPGLASGFASGTAVYFPYIDQAVSVGTDGSPGTLSSPLFQFLSSFNLLVRVVKGTEPNPIQEFVTSLATTAAGGSVNAVRNSDI